MRSFQLPGQPHETPQINVHQWAYVLLILNQCREYGSNLSQHYIGIDLLPMPSVPTLIANIQFLAPLTFMVLSHPKIQTAANFIANKVPILRLTHYPLTHKFYAQMASACYLLLSANTSSQFINDTIDNHLAIPINSPFIKIAGYLVRNLISLRITGEITKNLTTEYQTLIDGTDIRFTNIIQSGHRIYQHLPVKPYRYLHSIYCAFITFQLSNQLLNNYPSNILYSVFYLPPLLAPELRKLSPYLKPFIPNQLFDNTTQFIERTIVLLSRSKLALSTQPVGNNEGMQKLQTVFFLILGFSTQRIVKSLSKQLLFSALNVLLAPYSPNIIRNAYQLVMVFLSNYYDQLPHSVLSGLGFLANWGAVQFAGEMAERLPLTLPSLLSTADYYGTLAKKRWVIYQTPTFNLLWELSQHHKVYGHYEKAISVLRNSVTPPDEKTLIDPYFVQRGITTSEQFLAGYKDLHSAIKTKQLKQPPSDPTKGTLAQYIKTQCEIAFCQLCSADEKIKMAETHQEYQAIISLATTARVQIDQLCTAVDKRAFGFLQSDIIIAQAEFFQLDEKYSIPALRRMLATAIETTLPAHTNIVTMALEQISNWFMKKCQTPADWSYDTAYHRTEAVSNHPLHLYQQAKELFESYSKQANSMLIDSRIKTLLTQGSKQFETALNQLHAEQEAHSPINLHLGASCSVM